jgi:hypothetical protein
MRLLACLVVAFLTVLRASVLASEGPDDDRHAAPSPAAVSKHAAERGPIAKAAMVEVSRMTRAPRPARDGFTRRQSQAPRSRSWIGRHPAIFGALVGFGAGYLIGYLPGDDAVFDDFTAGFNGWVMGGVGAGVGAATGAIIGAIRK